MLLQVKDRGSAARLFTDMEAGAGVQGGSDTDAEECRDDGEQKQISSQGAAISSAASWPLSLVSAMLPASLGYQNKRDTIGVHPFLVQIWTIIRSTCPMLLVYIGERPPRCGAISSSIFLVY